MLNELSLSEVKTSKLQHPVLSYKVWLWINGHVTIGVNIGGGGEGGGNQPASYKVRLVFPRNLDCLKSYFQASYRIIEGSRPLLYNYWGGGGGAMRPPPMLTDGWTAVNCMRVLTVSRAGRLTVTLRLEVVAVPTTAAILELLTLALFVVVEPARNQSVAVASLLTLHTDHCNMEQWLQINTDHCNMEQWLTDQYRSLQYGAMVTDQYRSLQYGAMVNRSIQITAIWSNGYRSIQITAIWSNG